MRELRQKIIDLLRRHPETASDIADILDYMDTAYIPANSRNGPKAYFRGYNDSLYEHRPEGKSCDLRVRKDLVMFVIKSIPPTGFRANELLDKIGRKTLSEVYLRVVLRFLVHYKLLIKRAGCYNIPSKTFRKSALETYQQLPEVPTTFN